MLRVLAMPMTVAPRLKASCVATDPTPPAAALMTTTSPLCRFSCLNAPHEVCEATPRQAA